MPLIFALVLLTLLKLFAFGWFAAMSWWWIIGLAIAAFLWFEFFERLFGFDTKHAQSEAEKAKQERIRNNLKRP